MDISMKLIMWLLVLLAMLPSVLAQSHGPGVGFGFIMFFMFLFFAIAIAATVFWIVMIVDCAKREFDSEGEKVAWILVVVLVGFVGAIIYYFVGKRRGKKKRKKR